jgi:hypothetical protein
LDETYKIKAISLISTLQRIKLYKKGGGCAEPAKKIGIKYLQLRAIYRQTFTAAPLNVLLQSFQAYDKGLLM